MTALRRRYVDGVCASITLWWAWLCQSGVKALIANTGEFRPLVSSSRVLAGEASRAREERKGFGKEDEMAVIPMMDLYNTVMQKMNTATP